MQPELKSLPDCCEALLKAQEEVKAAIHLDPGGFDVAQGQKRNSEGSPFLSPEDIRVDWSVFDDLLGRIIRLVGQYSDSPIDVEGRSASSFGPDGWHDSLLPGFVQDRTVLEQAAARADVGLELFAFLTCQALIPFVEAHAEQVRENADRKTWLKGNCPVCGAEPLMGRLEKETGKRYLQCHLCRTDWEFKRIDCPFCGNSDQGTLRFFYDEEDEVNRVEVCDLSKTYLKTVDTRKVERDVVLVVEDLATIHLDLIAQSEGFHRTSQTALP